MNGLRSICGVTLASFVALGLLPACSDDGDGGPAEGVAGNAGGGFGGIVGVPWQLLARDPKDPSQGYKPDFELAWDQIAGDTDTYVDPADPFMVQSVDPRSGTSTTAGESTAPPESAS